MTLDTFFPGDSYHTPPQTRRAWLDRLALGTGAYLYARFIGVIVRSRWQLALGRYDRRSYIQSGIGAFRAVEAAGGRFHITGLNHIRHTAGPVVFIGNHMSALENNVLPGIIAPIKPVTFVIKASLLKYPLFSGLLRSQRVIPLVRENPREDLQKVLTDGSALLAEGISIIIYPEGHRRETFDPKGMNSLGMRLAKRAGVPAIPMAVKTNFWGNGRYLRDFGAVDRSQPIHIAFGPPIAADDMRAAHQQCVAFIADSLRSWGMPVR